MKMSLVLLVLPLAVAGCRGQPSAAPATSSAADKWLGRWDGPEDTYLILSKSGDHYRVEVRDLDGSRTFVGFPNGDRIRFVRDGKTEFLAAGDGEAAGMKWLLNKKDCLLTHKGEGWCRD
jgi:hypothetical protein